MDFPLLTTETLCRRESATAFETTMTTSAIRFGVWAPVHGPRAALDDPAEPLDASWAHNKRVVLEAEALGFDSTLIAQHTVNPHLPKHDQLETWTAAAALAALTSRIEIIAAIKPFIHHPIFLAKMALQIENISEGRFALNLVNAWNKPEFEKAGIPFLEHEDRYAYGREWMSVVSRLLSGETVTHKGNHFDIRHYTLTPKSLYRDRPLIYVGGESEPARALVNDLGDVWFINGQFRSFRSLFYALGSVRAASRIQKHLICRTIFSGCIDRNIQSNILSNDR